MPDTKKQHSTWNKAQIKNFVDTAKGRVGNEHAWQVVGPFVRRMVIRAECWNVMCLLTDFGETRISEKQTRTFERLMCKEAAIWEEDY